MMIRRDFLQRIAAILIVPSWFRKPNDVPYFLVKSDKEIRIKNFRKPKEYRMKIKYYSLEGKEFKERYLIESVWI